jgi:DNA modification methylase
MGSGTTNLVAQRMNRNSIGIEIQTDYYQMVKQKIQKRELALFKSEIKYETGISK